MLSEFQVGGGAETAPGGRANYFSNLQAIIIYKPQSIRIPYSRYVDSIGEEKLLRIMFDQVASRDDGTVNISELDQLCDKIGIEVSSQEVKGDLRFRKVVGITGSGRERAIPKLPPGPQAPGP